MTTEEISTRPDTRRTGLHPDFWYPVAQSSELKAGRTLPVTFAGDEIVLVRPEQGPVFALEDRCAHRQVPLHLGVVKDERVLCGYHCWTYDRTGKCVNVPYLDKSKSRPNGVRSYPAREAYGLVFVFPGDPAKAETTPFPELPYYADGHYKVRRLDRTIACHYSFMHENLMDMNHQFLHRSLMGRIRATLVDVREGGDWIEADYTFRRTAGKQNFERFVVGGGTSSGGDLMTIRTGYPYQSLTFRVGGSKDPALELWNAYVPTDAGQRANRTLGLIMIRKPRTPGLINLLWPVIVWFTEGIFGQDREIVEAEQRAFDRQGGDRNQELFPVIQQLKALLGRCGVPLAVHTGPAPAAPPAPK